MTAIIAALTPVLVSGLTQVSKYLVAKILRYVPTPWIIATVVVFSYLGALLNSAITGEPVDLNAITTLGDTLVNFLAATGTYFFAKKAIDE